MSKQAEPGTRGQSSTNPVGRPPKLNSDERKEVLVALDHYIHETDDPTIVGFVATDDTAYRYSVTRDNIKDWEEFSPLVKRAVDKQEHFLMKNGGEGKYNPTLAIFRLKQPQHGFRDRQELTGAEGRDLIPQELSKGQADQLMALRAKRAAN